MLFPTNIYFLYLVLGSALFKIAKTNFGYKFSLLSLLVLNILLIFLASPFVLLFISFEIFLMLSLFFLIKNFKINLNFSWILILPLIFLSGPLYNLQVTNNFKDLFSTLAYEGTPFKIGATFIVLKAFISLREWIKKDRIYILETLSSLTFIPSLPAGPIHGCLEWSKENVLKKQDKKANNLLLILSRIFWGLCSLMVISPLIYSFTQNEPNNNLELIKGIYLRFIALFFDFSGYSSIAIGSAALFGIKLPENFNQPFLATNIVEFWRRWHMTMSNFIGTYIYKPYVRITNKKRVGIFIAFCCAGIWHEISLPFIIWGFGQGVAMALTIKTINKPKKFPFISKIISYLVTFNLITILSSIATGYIKF